jgi:hypothetical protein
MRYWSYNDPEHDQPVTLSEHEIVRDHWDCWYQLMCRKYGREHVDQNYTVQDCVDDWVTVHWAWLSG